MVLRSRVQIARKWLKNRSELRSNSFRRLNRISKMTLTQMGRKGRVRMARKGGWSRYQLIRSMIGKGRILSIREVRLSIYCLEMDTTMLSEIEYINIFPDMEKLD